jgi:hypothetical protein
MSTIRARFKLNATERTALFQDRKTGEYSRENQQTDWGTAVTLFQVRGAGINPTGKLKMVLNPAEAKLFNDAPIGAEFDIVVSLAMSE